MARSRSTEWIIPSGYGVKRVVSFGVTLNDNLVSVFTTFDAYGTDEVTVLAVKGHIVLYDIETQVAPDPFGWRLRLGLEDLTSGATTFTGDIDQGPTAEEHFLDERWFLADPGDLAAVAPYYLKVDVSNKRIVRRGQVLAMSYHFDSLAGTVNLKAFLRCLVLL